MGEYAKIFDPAVGATAQKHVIDAFPLQLFAGNKTHIFERLCERYFSRLIDLLHLRDGTVDRHAHAGIGSVGDHRADVRHVERDLFVEYRVGIGFQRLPISHRLFPLLALGSELTPFQIGEGSFVRSDQPSPGAHLDAQVAECHPLLHGEVADGLAGVFHKVAGRTTRGELRNHIERHIFRSHVFAQFALEIHTHRLRARLQDTLRGQHHLHLARADAESNGAESSVRRGVAVAADDRHARLGVAVFGSYHVHDAVLRIIQSVIGEPEFLCVLGKRFDLKTGYLIANGLVLSHGRDVVVGRQGRLFGTEYFQSARTKSGKSLWTGYLVA